MATINKKNLKIITKLFDSGISSEKDISALGVDEILKIPNISVTEIQGIADLQKAIKTNKVLSFLSESEG